MALGAKVATAVSHRNALNSSAADCAAVATEAVGHLELKVAVAGLTAGREVRVLARPLVADSCPYYLLIGVRKWLALCRGEAPSHSKRLDPGGKQGFVSIHVTDAGDAVLVDEQCFYWCCTVAQELV